MKAKKNIVTSFFAMVLLALLLVHAHFSNPIFCIEADGTTAIEIAPLGNCVTVQENTMTTETREINQNCNQPHPDNICNNCTDISLKQEISLSRSDSEQATLKILSPTYFNLYASEFKPYLLYPNPFVDPLSFQTPEFIYHPHQVLESLILLI